jgi:dienelactone hydrolase
MGTLHMPDKKSDRPIPGVILMAEPEWIVRSTFDAADRAPALASKFGVAALSLDMRGSGGSLGSQYFATFSPTDVEKLQMDVRAAIKFLSSQSNVDPKRIGVLGAGDGAKYALLESFENPAVQALALVSGAFDEKAMSYLRRGKELPMFFVAAKDDPDSFRESAAAFSLSKSKHSDFYAAEKGHGTVIFSHEEGLVDKVMAWFAQTLQGLGAEKLITLSTPDGWTLYGKLRLPDSATSTKKAPAVVFVHGAQHDQETFFDLTRELSRKGIATLTFNQRNRGAEPYRSISKGRSTRANTGEVPIQDADRVHLPSDIQLAVKELALHPEVDSSRVALLSATAATTNALEAALDDTRIKTQVILSQYVLTDKAKQYLTSTDTPIFFVVSSEDVNFQIGSLFEETKKAYGLAKNKSSQLLLYDGGGRGSEMLKKRPELKGMVTSWLEEKLK